MRICVVCGEKAWADEERNWSAAEDAAGGSLKNPGRDAYLRALEMRELERGSVLCGTCLSDIVGLAWSMVQREQYLEEQDREREETESSSDESLSASEDIPDRVEVFIDPAPPQRVVPVCVIEGAAE